MGGGIHLTHRTNARKNGRAILGMQRIVTQPQSKIVLPGNDFLLAHAQCHAHTHMSCENTVERVGYFSDINTE